MYHPRFKGSHYDMGKKFGEILLKSNVKFPIHLDEFQKSFGRESQNLLKKYFPEVVEEIKGVTDVIDFDNELFTSWLICMGCCLYINDSTSVEVRGCTAFAFTKDGYTYYARNNDLPPFLKKVSKSVFYKPDKGNEFIMNTSSFINGEEGINNKGLVVAMTFVCPKIHEIRPGINSLFLVRYILEKCSNVEEGIKTLNRLPIASSCNILLADKNREMVVVECNPEKIVIRKPTISNNGNKAIVTVNHFVKEEMWCHDASDRNVYESKKRYKNAYNSLNKEYLDKPIDYAISILKGKHGFMCQYEKDLDFQTIWGTVIDIEKLKMYRAEGDPRKAKFRIDNRLIY